MNNKVTLDVDRRQHTRPGAGRYAVEMLPEEMAKECDFKRVGKELRRGLYAEDEEVPRSKKEGE